MKISRRFFLALESRLLLIASSLLLLLLVGGGGNIVHAAVSRETPSSFADLVKRVESAVVNISTTQVSKGQPLHPFLAPDSPFHDFFGDEFRRYFGDQPQAERKTHALGSGVLIDSDGLILTNNHVVEKATEIKVKTKLGKEYDAKLVGRDSKTDLALIRVELSGDLPRPVPLGDSDAIEVGDWVIAVGNPFGLGNTVTSGIISAKGRIIGAGAYDDFLQTDAAINPGNSGGPLINMAGEVVGINTAIVAQGQGIGFSIPVNLAKQLLPQLKAGKVVRGWLGIAIQDVSEDLAKALDLKELKGVLVSDVTKGSPAESAGIRRGDVIRGIAGKDIVNAHALSSMVAAMRPGSEVTLDIIRDGRLQSITVTIGTMPDQKGEPSVREETRWGLSVRDLTPELATRFGLNTDEEGVLITGIEPGSPAAQADLRKGDLIKEVNRRAVRNVDGFKSALSRAGESVLLLVKRGESTFYTALSKGRTE